MITLISILYAISLYILFFLLNNSEMSLVAAICTGTIGGLLGALHRK
jgi:hypothetical protein